MPLSLPDLPYPHDALAPYMSRETLEFHHDKHHLAYVNTANDKLKGNALENKPLEEIVKGSYNQDAVLFNNAGQHYNHLHFWKWMKPQGGGDKFPDPLGRMITSDLGGAAKARTDFVQAGVTQFGSGWCWISVANGKLVISKTPNGENPLVHGAQPILGCDVWEHAYYLDHRNLRPAYLQAFWDHLINWDYVNELLVRAMK
jgi:Fe-Mn family superoxide dismutase